MSEPSASYYRALRATQVKHASSPVFSGRFLLRYLEDVRMLVREHAVETVLDYGCGKGHQWTTEIADGQGMLADILGVRPTLYDPGWPQFAAEPQGQFDMVICTQALGSIPIIDLPWVVMRMMEHARRVLYVGEKLGPVRKRIHKDMAGEMPHEWTHDQWAAELQKARMPGKTIALRTNDKRTSVSRLEQWS